MRKLIFLLLILISVLLITTCSSDDSNNPIIPDEPGSILISSSPDSAQIWLDGDSTGLATQDTIFNLDEGVYTITLKLQDFNDTTFSVSVTAGEMNIVPSVSLESNIYTNYYGPVRIYETFGTDSTRPSGLDLSSGMAYGLTSSNSGLVDIYYSSNGFLVQSADLYPGLIRETDFLVGSSTNLYDGEDSPLNNTGTWSDNIGDREPNYVFLYDHDGHYSKLKIVSWNSGGPGDPAWVEVLWYYNTTTLDNRFD